MSKPFVNIGPNSLSRYRFVVRWSCSLIPLLTIAAPHPSQAQSLVLSHTTPPVTPAIGSLPDLSIGPSASPKGLPPTAKQPIELNVVADIFFANDARHPQEWAKLFPVVMRDGTFGTCAISSEQHFLDRFWLARCLSGKNSNLSDKPAPVAVPLDALLERIETANQIFYQNGYINSGVKYDPRMGEGRTIQLDVISGKLEGGDGVPCSMAWPGKGKLHQPPLARRYIRQRLMRGCHANRPFNIYLLGRDFARLADDRDPWIHKVNIAIVPCKLGIATLAAQSSATGRAPCPASPSAIDPSNKVGPAEIVRQHSLVITAGVANDRSPSIGSFREFVRIGYYGIAGASLDLEGGATDGALDGAGALTVAVAPRITAAVSGQANQADVVDPALRPLGIRSSSWGGDASIYFGAIHCPITQIYGDPIVRVPRQANASFDRCRLAVRLPGDGVVGWAPGRDVTIGLTISHEVSRTSLLGQPFSFSPGSIDGLSSDTALRASIDLLERGRVGLDGERGWTLEARLMTSFGLDGSASDIIGLRNPSSHFFALRGQAGFAYQLGLAHLTLESRVAGQWSAKPLYTAERFSVGGVNSVRGYPEAALLADRALVGSAGLNRNFSLAGKSSPEDSTSFDLSRFRITAFIDVAAATTLGPFAQTTNRLASVGTGVAWIPSAAAQFSIEYGCRLSPSLSGLRQSLADDGIHLSVALELADLYRAIILHRKGNSV